MSTSRRSEDLLVDTNLLVLYTIGTVNRYRIENFKRTRKYRIQDFDLLLRVLRYWRSLYTVPHILAEVSNLTDLSGPERVTARQVLKETISVLDEKSISSFQATQDPNYISFGLVDTAISAIARQHQCTVLTDDLDLFLLLQSEDIAAIDFTYRRAADQGL